MDQLKQAMHTIALRLGRAATAAALVLGGASASFAAQEAAIVEPAAAVESDTGSYPWADAEHVAQPPARDPYTWGYKDRDTCNDKSSTYNCNSAKIGDYYYRDQWGYDLNNCVSYAAWRLAEEFGVDAANLGNAKDWSANAAKDKKWPSDKSPEVGDIAQWNATKSNAYGHVALVEEVGNGDKAGKVRIAEYNQGLNGKFRNDRWVTADNYIDVNGKNAAGFKLKVGGESGSTSEPRPVSMTNCLGCLRHWRGTLQA